MQRLRFAFLGLLFALLVVGPALAQGARPLIDDPDKLFADTAAIQAAAQRLAGEGADVVVIGVRDAGANPQSYLDRRLQQLGVAPNARALAGNQIVFFVAPRPGFSGIFFVPQYKQKLQSVYQSINTQQMRPFFTREDYSGGMVAGIDAVRTTLNPPTSPVVWVGGGALALVAAGAVAGPALRRRKTAAESLAAARRSMEESRRAAGVALADLGQRVTAAREKAQYDRISYAPADAERVGTLQQQGESLFVRAQSAFDAAEQTRTEQTNPGAGDFESLAAKYAEIRQIAEEAVTPIEQAERLRATLDDAAGGAPSLPGSRGSSTPIDTAMPATGKTERL